jgi:hypothetical protein
MKQPVQVEEQNKREKEKGRKRRNKRYKEERNTNMVCRTKFLP